MIRGKFKYPSVLPHGPVNNNEKDKIITEKMVEKSMRPINYIHCLSKDKKKKDMSRISGYQKVCLMIVT